MPNILRLPIRMNKSKSNRIQRIVWSQIANNLQNSYLKGVNHLHHSHSIRKFKYVYIFVKIFSHWMRMSNTTEFRSAARSESILGR